MRPPQSAERRCSQGEQCECMLMAHEVPFFAESDGFVGVAFYGPNADSPSHDDCLLCLRKRVLLSHADVILKDQSNVGATQPHAVVCGPGEYSEQACILISAAPLSNVVAPFVKHERHHYIYGDQRIKQTSAVNFRSAFCSEPPD